jgi:hypothetical protein
MAMICCGQRRCAGKPAKVAPTVQRRWFRSNSWRSRPSKVFLLVGWRSDWSSSCGRVNSTWRACQSYGPGQWQLLSERFAQLGGDDALRGSSPSVELLVTALELATASMNAQVMATEAADLLVSVNQVTSIHPTLAGQVSQHWIERRAAQQLERIGRLSRSCAVLAVPGEPTAGIAAGPSHRE